MEWRGWLYEGLTIHFFCPHFKTPLASPSLSAVSSVEPLLYASIRRLAWIFVARQKLFRAAILGGTWKPGRRGGRVALWLAALPPTGHFFSLGGNKSSLVWSLRSLPFQLFQRLLFSFLLFNIFYWTSSSLWPPFFPSISSLASSLTSRLQSPPAAPPPSAFAFVVSFSQFTFWDHHSNFSFQLVLFLFNYHPLPFRFLAPAVMTFSPFTPFNLVHLCFWAFQSTSLASSAAKP